MLVLVTKLNRRADFHLQMPRGRMPFRVLKRLGEALQKAETEETLKYIQALRNVYLIKYAALLIGLTSIAVKMILMNQP